MLTLNITGMVCFMMGYLIMFENEYNMFYDKGWFLHLISIGLLMVIGRMLCGKLMKWMDIWQVKEFIKDVELIKRTREILVDDNITKDYDKLMITDAFRLHFLKYNKL